MPQQLYQQLIIDHNRQPIGRDKVISISHSAQGENPSCGDELELYLQLEQQQIEDIGFTSDACAICTASASLLCEQLSGKNLTQAATMATNLQNKLCTNNGDIDDSLAALTAVSQFPSRVNCALLPWSTLSQIIQGAKTP